MILSGKSLKYQDKNYKINLIRDRKKRDYRIRIILIQIKFFEILGPADDKASQINTDCRNFTLDFKYLGLCASPFFLKTLGPGTLGPPGRYGSGGKSCRLAVRGLPVRSHPGRVEVSLSKTPNPQLFLMSWLVPCMAANCCWCVNR